MWNLSAASWNAALRKANEPSGSVGCLMQGVWRLGHKKFHTGLTGQSGESAYIGELWGRVHAAQGQREGESLGTTRRSNVG